MDVFIGTFLVVLFLILLSLIAYSYRKHSMNYWQSRNVPCIEPSFLYGNMEGVGKEHHLAFTLKKIYDTFKGTGVKFCGSYFYSRPVAILLDLDLMKDIWIKDFNNFTDRGLYYNAKDDPLSANLATVDGEEWKSLRTKLTPTFISGKMKFIFPTIVKVAESLNEVLKEFVHKNGDEVKIKDFMLRYTADVIGTTAFGIDCNSLKNPNAEFINVARSISSEPRHSAQFIIFITTFANLARKFGIKVIPDKVSNFFMNIVKETIEYRETNNVHRNDFMDILISLKNQDSSETLTVDEIAGHAWIFFLGGFDSTSIALTNCVYILAMNPDIQTKARKIVLECFDRHQGEFTYEMLAELSYVDQIIKETLRIHALSGSVNRFAKSDYQVPGTNHIIEKGTWIKLPMFAIQRDPEYYPDPEKFDPDRFESNEFRKRHAMTWMPFGDGPRGCIGMRFSMMNMQIVLTMLLKNFEILRCEKTVDTLNFNPKKTLLHSNDDIIVKIRPIKTKQM